jgi:hypothetical protein
LHPPKLLDPTAAVATATATQLLLMATRITNLITINKIATTINPSTTTLK